MGIYNNVSFGEILRKSRKIAELSQKQLGEKADIDHSEISRFETNLKLPSSEALFKILGVLAEHDVPTDYIEKLQLLAGYEKQSLSWSKTPPANDKILYINQLFYELHDSVSQGRAQHDLIASADANLNLAAAQALLAERKWQDGLQRLERAERNADGLQELFHRIYSASGLAHYQLGQYAKAIDYLERALHCVKHLQHLKMGDETSLRLTEAELCLQLGTCHRRRSEWKVAEDYFASGRNLYANVVTKAGRIGTATALIELAGLHNFKGDGHEALEYCQQALAIGERENDPKTIYKAWQHQAWASRLLGRWDDALTLNLQALDKIHQTTHDEAEMVRANIYLGETYRLRRRYEDAEQCYLEAQKRLRKSGDEGQSARLHQGLIMLGLGQVYLKRPSERHKAQDLLDQSFEIYMELGEDFRLAVVQNELGNVLKFANQLERARARLEAAADRFRRLGTPFFYIGALVNICEVYLQLGDYGELALKIDEALNYPAPPNVAIHRARICLLQAQAAVKQGALEKVTDACCRALTFANRFNDDYFEETMDRVTAMADIHERDGKPEVAQAYFQGYQRFVAEQHGSLSPSVEAYRKYIETKLNAEPVMTPLK